MNSKSKNIIKSLVVVSILFLGIYLYVVNNRSIKTIHSFNEVNFSSIESDTLVVLDVDETLIQPIDSYYVNEFTEKGINFKKKLFTMHPEITNWDIYADITLKEVQRPLIEPMIIKTINELQQRGIPVIACTGMNTGKFGTLERLEAWRYEHLKSLGFQGSFSDLMVELPFENHKPVFYKGVLVADRAFKGPIIVAFINYINYVPKKIIMFDNTLEDLESALNECKKRDINFQGYLYKGASEKSWDEELINFQSEYLIKHKKWLSDDEARLLAR